MSESKLIKKRYVAALILGASILSFFLGIAAYHSFLDKSEQDLQQKYSLLAKRTLISNPNDIVLNVSGLRERLESYINDNQLGTTVSMYFEYLPTGSSVGINETEQLVGASLLKTPLAVNLYKQAELGRINLDTKIALKKEWLNSQYGNLYKKGVGYQISLRDLSYVMLTESDNTAALAIYDTLSGLMDINDKLLDFVDIDYSSNKDESVRLSPESYGNILKCLYFSCYTNKQSSQEILQTLSESKDSSRLDLFLPNSVKLAHKIGTFDTDQNSAHVQSDCGIAYIPNRNYMVCIMVKGDDPRASRIIGDLSLITYTFIENAASSKNEKQ